MGTYYTLENINNSGEFLRFPKELLKEKYENVSSDAKILYMLFISRTKISAANGWQHAGRVYIIYTIQEICDTMSCRHTKANTMLNELTKAGLIEKKRQGLGKPNIIFVKRPDTDNGKADDRKSGCQETGTATETKTGDNTAAGQNHCNNGARTADMQSTAYAVTRNNNNINYNNNNLINLNQDQDKDKDTIELVKDNLEYVTYAGTDDLDGMYEGLVDIVCDVVCIKSDTVRANRQDMPAAVVKSRFLKLTHEHLQYVCMCLKRQTTKIYDIKNYLITALFNAPGTMDAYYYNAVRSDAYAALGLG